MLQDVLATLEDAKAEDTVAIDLAGKTSLADAMIVTSGRSNRHVGAIADQLIEKLKAEGHTGMRRSAQLLQSRKNVGIGSSGRTRRFVTVML
jgi:ribosome silencing factor RsfS/YbeB/iojap